MCTFQRLLISIAVLTLLVCGSAHASGNAFVANEKVCKAPTHTQLEWLDASTWGPFSEYVRVCSISSPKRPPLLLLISVWADLYYSDKPSGTETVAMPKPLLFTPKGKQVGELPVNFPTDPPSELVLFFADWRKGFPYEIRLCVASPAASGDQVLSPLRYVPAAQRYQQAAEEGGSAPSGGCRGR